MRNTKKTIQFLNLTTKTDEGRIAFLEAECKHLQKQLAGIDEEHGKVRSQYTSYILSLEEMVKERDNEIRQWKSRHDELTQIASNLREELKAAKEKTGEQINAEVRADAKKIFLEVVEELREKVEESF